MNQEINSTMLASLDRSIALLQKKRIEIATILAGEDDAVAQYQHDIARNEDPDSEFMKEFERNLQSKPPRHHDFLISLKKLIS